MTVTLFYSFLDPTTFFIAAIACLNIYVIDRYLLLRNSAQPPMLDNSMGPTVSSAVYSIYIHVSCVCVSDYLYGYVIVDCVLQMFKQVEFALLAKLMVSLYFAWRFVRNCCCFIPQYYIFTCIETAGRWMRSTLTLTERMNTSTRNNYLVHFGA